jgi:hypothetical protein
MENIFKQSKTETVYSTIQQDIEREQEEGTIFKTKK